MMVALVARLAIGCVGEAPTAPTSAAVDRLTRDWERMVAYYAFPQEHWKHLRTTNIIESPFAAVRLRTSAAKR